MRGDDREIVIAATYPESNLALGIKVGDPYPLVASTVWFSAVSPGASILKKTGNGITVSGNMAVVSIDAADTNSLLATTVYTWEVQVRTGGKIQTLSQGLLTVREDIVRETI